MNNTHALEINNITYFYPHDWLGKKTLALNDISLSVNSGESFGFIGHNGAGKTTTIKIILDLVAPKDGTIKIFGESNKDPDVRKNVGYVPEQPYFYDQLSVQELMTMYAKLCGIERSTIDEKIHLALKKLRISKRKNQKLRSLSKGLTQRVAMAQAIVNNPKLLILDEPFSGLDPIGRKEFKDLLSELKSDGTTIFISSHILEDIEFLCDRASIMVKGDIKTVIPLDGSANLEELFVELVTQNEAYHEEEE